MAIHISRYKPVGWRNDSYRHYLAAKGVPTRRYLARYDYDPRFALMTERRGSGNFREPAVKSKYRAGWTNATMRAALMQDPNVFGGEVTYADVAPIPRYKKKYPGPTPEQVGFAPTQVAVGEFAEQLQPTTPVPSLVEPQATVAPQLMTAPQQFERPLPVGALPEGEEPLDTTFDEPPPSTEKLNRMSVMSPGVPELKLEFDRLE